MKNTSKISMGLAVGALVFALTACGPSGNKPNVELIQDMMESPAIKAQEFEADAVHNRGMLVPPEGTAPVGFTPYKYGTDIEAASKQANPMAGQMDEETLKVGQKFYETNCTVCHGSNGEGGVAAKSTVAEKMALKPPTLLSEKIVGWTDGHIYHVITQGQGVMGPHASHIPQQYRWQVVNYIRFLQKQDSK